MTATARATPFALPLRQPLRIAAAVVPARFGALIEIEGGCGEATAPPGATIPDQLPDAAVRAALAVAALDAEARAAGVPVAALLGGVRRRTIALNALIAAVDPEAAAAEAAAWVGRGFRCLKLKLAPRDLDGDRRRLAAVRAAVGSSIALRLDANAAWSVDYAVAALRALAEFDLEYVEQPVADLAELAAVRRAVQVPIAADEAVVDADSVDRIIDAGAAGVILLKPSWLGLRESIDAAHRAHAAGLAVTVTSALDSSIGIAAAAQVAAAIEGPLRACGLATAELLAGDLTSQSLPIIDGAMVLSDAPGLGVDLDRGALARFQTGAAYVVGRDFRPARPREVRPSRSSAGPSGAEPPLHASLLATRAETYPDRIALTDATRTLTFAALRARAGAVAARLDVAGVRRGDRVALLLGDRLTFAVWLHGATYLGAVAIPLGERLTAGELAQQLHSAGCRALVTDDHTAALAATLPPALTGARLDADDLDGDADGPTAPFDPTAPHTIVFTSGSSGAPKPILLTAGNHYWNAIGSALALGVGDDDRWFACLPLHHVGGLAILMRGLVSAVPVLLQPRFDAAAVNDAIDNDGVTRVSLVPTMLQRVLAARGARPFPDSLLTVLLGGAAAPRALLDECARRRVPVVTTYGMTEAASQIAVQGRPLCGVAVRVRRDGATVAPGELGLIEVTGPVISPERLDADGWLATRDLGRIDAQGRLEVVGRADDVIITGGENVHPREVEQALESHVAVAEACAFGLPDPLWGEIVAAWVRPIDDAGLDANSLAAHARARLAACKVPRRLTIVGDFPRSPAGKILRRAVRAAAGG